jgi:hypothetical protein
MLDAAEAARRRELHQRVYAPGGSLSDAEIAELHELDNRHLAVAAPPAAPAPPAARPAAPVRGAGQAASVPADATAPDPRTEQAGASGTSADVRGAGRAVSDTAGAAISDPRADDARGEQTPPAPAPAPRAGRWMLALVSAVALLVGLGAGWLVFAGADRTTMTAAQQEVWSDLEASGDYDAGSIQVVGAKYGATTWTATQQDAKRTCVILTRKDQDPAAACRPSAGDHDGFDLQVSLDYTEDGDRYILFAALVEDVGGDPVTVIQRQNMTDGGWDWRSQYSEVELAQVDLLEQTGLDGEWLTLLGYDGVIPIWLYQGDRTCLMVVVHDTTEVAQQCGSLTTDPEMPLQLAIGDAVYSALDSYRGPSLTILRSSPPTQVTCDAAAGDCASIDDTTGEID